MTFLLFRKSIGDKFAFHLSLKKAKLNQKLVTRDLPGGKRSRNMKIRAQLKILTERDID